MKKRNILQIALAAGIVTTGLYTGEKEADASGFYYGENVVKKVKIPKNKQVQSPRPRTLASTAPQVLLNTRTSIPTTVEQLKQLVEVGIPKNIIKNGKKLTPKVAVVKMDNGNQYTIELDGSFSSHRNNDSVTGTIQSVELTMNDKSKYTRTKKTK